MVYRKQRHTLGCGKDVQQMTLMGRNGDNSSDPTYTQCKRHNVLYSYALTDASLRLILPQVGTQ